jgi:L-amino acid N-acyltransferase YncA
MTEIRRATPSDIPAMIDIGRAMHAESSFAPMDFDAETLAATLHRLMADDQFALVAEDADGKTAGVMIGLISPSWFGRDWTASDLALYLTPEHRGGATAARMVKAFVIWAREAGAKQIRPGVSTGQPGALNLYAGLGFTPVGQLFCMNMEG